MTRNVLIATGSLVMVLGAASAGADVLVATDFNGNTISGTGDSTLNVTWTGVESASASAFTAVTGGGGFKVAGSQSTVNNAYLDWNLNQSAADPHGLSFTFTPGTGYGLTSLTIDVAHLNSAGGDQQYDSDLTLTISNGGTVFTETRNVSYIPSPVFQNQVFDLTGSSLAASTSYTVTLSMNNLPANTGAFATFDNLTLEGNVPEPGSLALLGLGGLAILRRRRG